MSGGRSSSDFNEPDINYYNLVESYMSSTREILNGYMTFERGLVRILNNRIIFRNVAPVHTPAGPVPVSEHAAPLQRMTEQPQAQPVPLSQPPSTTATFIRYRLPLPSRTTRATRGITTPNASTISIFSSPPQSPPPLPPPPPLQPHSHTQSLSPIIPISSRINNYDWLNFIETNNITMNRNNINRRDVALTDFQEQRLQQQQRLRQREQEREQEQQQEQQQEREQDESGSNYISYDRVQMATKLIPFCTIVDPQNDICPISQIQFEEIDCIMQIKYCRHNFNPYSLFRWLDSNSTCPMCRYNLNAYSNDGVRPRRNNNNDTYPEISESESESG